MWMAAAIGALIGAALGIALSYGLNSYGLTVVDWARQDFLSGGTSNPAAWGALGAVTGGFTGLIIRATR